MRPMPLGRHGSVRQICLSELLQAVYRSIKPRYLLQFCRSFEVKFWFPQFGGTRALIGVGLRGVRWGVSDFLLIALQSTGVYYGFAAVFNLPILGEGVPLGGRRWYRWVVS